MAESINNKADYAIFLQLSVAFHSDIQSTQLCYQSPSIHVFGREENL
jgi:hypothetical protein